MYFEDLNKMSLSWGGEEVEKLKKAVGLIVFGLVLAFMGDTLKDIIVYLRPNEFSIAGTVGHVGLLLIGVYSLGWFAWGIVILNMEDKKEKQD